METSQEPEQVTGPSTHRITRSSRAGPPIPEDDEDAEPEADPSAPDPPADPDGDDGYKEDVYNALRHLGNDRKREREAKVNEYSWAYNQTMLYRPTIELY